ncbi:bacteriophage antitermination protein Q [Enterobacter quasiroggenkampii]|uniref:bacteriophage antitermination protein Q n=1 Tax=Enterobacter quasiroggenkampii TaxID=2497436 RepID=UPI0021D3D1DA|nr:bacteriophage antitermination protein Q [Enterobacter quasiroggenkampii]MCU6327476.1 bacteriophage antitermination protein Q [Enterobacter quasiroggenkampii]
MNAQQLEYIRIQLRAALADHSGRTKGQLEALAEHCLYNAQSTSQNKNYQIGLIDRLKDGTQSVTMAVIENRHETKANPLINDVDFNTSKWRRAVLRLNKLQASWICYCYGLNLDFDIQTYICEKVWKLFQEKSNILVVQKRVVKKTLPLVWLAVQEVASAQKNYEYREYAGAVLATMMCINKSTWGRVYSPQWKLLKEIVRELDESSLFQVSKNLKV